MPPSRWAPLAALWSAAHRYAAATVSGDGQRAAALRAGLGDHSADPGAARRALEHLAVVPLDELPAAAAVYLIAERGGPRRYVGLARDVAARFHTEPFGHLCEQNSTRSRELVAGPFDVAVEVYDDADDLHLATSEVFWWLVGRNAGLDMVNSTATLGRVGAAEGAPIVACELASGRYRVFRCTSDAARRLRIPAGQISTVTCHWQNQTGGYAFRYAHPDEAAQQPAGWAADPRGVPEVARDGNRILWLAGPLPDTDRERLASVRRPARYDKSAASKLWGVVATPGRPGRWTAYYVYDPARRSRWRAVGRDFPDAVTAAVAREAFLDGHPEFAAINRRNDVASPI